MFRRARRAGPRRRRRRARALSRRGRAARSRRPFPGTVATASSTARRSRAAVLGDPERLQPARGDRASAGARASSDALPRRRAAARRAASPCSTSRCCSRPAASGAATPSLVVTAPPERAARARAGPAGHDGGEARRDPRQADAGRREARDAPHFLVDTGRGFAAAERAGRDILRDARRPAGPRAARGRTAEGRRMREIVLDTETTGLDPTPATASSRSAASSCSTTSRPGAPSTSTSIPQRAMPAGRLQRARPHRRVPRRQAALRRGRRRLRSPSSATRRLVDPQRRLRHRLPQCRARAAPAIPPLDLTRVVDTLALARRKHPGRPEQPRRALRALRHRQFAPHQARRAARRRDPGRGLYRADRRQAGRSRPRHYAPAAPVAPAARRQSCARDGAAAVTSRA